MSTAVLSLFVCSKPCLIAETHVITLIILIVGSIIYLIILLTSFKNNVLQSLFTVRKHGFWTLIDEFSQLNSTSQAKEFSNTQIDCSRLPDNPNNFFKRIYLCFKLGLVSKHYSCVNRMTPSIDLATRKHIINNFLYIN